MSYELITVTPKQTSNGVQWQLCHDGKCGGPGNNPAGPYPTIEIGQGSHPLVIFQIRFDPGGPSGITFKDVPGNPLSADNAFWVTPGLGKTPGQGHNTYNQFDNILLTSPTSLVFNDRNQKNEGFSYKLHFNGAPSIDPDITNGGKGFAISSDLAVALIGAAVVASLVAAFVASFVAKRVARKTA